MTLRNKIANWLDPHRHDSCQAKQVAAPWMQHALDNSQLMISQLECEIKYLKGRVEVNNFAREFAKELLKEITIFHPLRYKLLLSDHLHLLWLLLIH